jgi:hypothetical protein
MKTILCLLLFMSHSLFAKTDLLHRWKLGYEAKANGGHIRGYERLVITPKATYSVAEMTVLEIPADSKQSLDALPEILKTGMKLEGFTQTTKNDTTRFEGYSSKIRRQVVIHVTTTKTSTKVTSAFYRPFYGRKIALEVELFQRNEHDIASFKKTSFTLPDFFTKAYAEDCTKCAGNPSCLLLCRSANNASTPSNPSALMGMDLSGIQGELTSSNQQLEFLNQSITAGANSISEIATSANSINANAANIGAQVNTNWSETNEEAARLNDNLEKLNETAQSTRDTIKAESDEWQEMMDGRSERALRVGEKMSDPNHMFKLSASSAAGAVIGASVANLAIAGIKSAVGFLVKWVSGDLKRMKEDQIIKEFGEAMQVYEQSSKLSLELEKRIDNILASMELHKRFKLENADVLENLQRYVIDTNFKIEDANACRDTDKLLDLNRQLVEYQSLSKILDVPNPLKKMCEDMKESFQKLAEIEGILQNARPNLLKAEEALTNRRARNQNKAAKTIDRLQTGDMYENVAESQRKQRRRLQKKNEEDTRELRRDILDDCSDSFKPVANRPEKKVIRTYCETLFTMDKEAPNFNLDSSFPTISAADKTAIAGRFRTHFIPMGLEKHRAYEEQRQQLFADSALESDRHQEVVGSLKDRMSLDPEIALKELESINAFVERIMKEQSYLFTNGLKSKQRKIEEACAGIE